MTKVLNDDDLPGVWRDADRSSLKAQKLTLRLTRAKVGGSVFAALGGALSWQAGQVDLAAVIILSGFIIALVAEVVAWVDIPERRWYQSRAVAESAKTLAWRYSVGADPFPAEMPRADAEDVLRSRLSRITHELSEAVVFEESDIVVTERMDELRRASFEARRSAYIDGRTVNQKDWYAAKANFNSSRALRWRIVLVLAEFGAVMLALGKLFGGWQVDFAGVLAAFIAAGAAWVAVKQFSPLASAYSVATAELGIQASRLRAIEEDRWPLVVADAEEAISREHTTWLASRTGRPAGRVQD